MKQCIQCGATKTTTWCKGPMCRKCHSRQLYRKNRDKELQRHKIYNEAHKEQKRQYDRDYYQQHKVQKLQCSKKHNHEHSEEIRQYRREYNNSHREQRLQRERQRMKHDVQFRLAKSLRSRLRDAIRTQQKTGSAVRDLGCSISFLMQYLESKFQPGMTWDNYGQGRGKWNIDHIYPLSKTDLTNRAEFLRVCHYTNLQPLWHVDNVSKYNKITGHNDETLV